MRNLRSGAIMPKYPWHDKRKKLEGMRNFYHSHSKHTRKSFTVSNGRKSNSGTLRWLHYVQSAKEEATCQG